jgi:NAD(P)-dependent dehydrogenase (short-subunit alcohol dehydrogenase family)
MMYLQAVANAGIGAWADISEMDLDLWKKVVGTNYDGVFHLARIVGPLVVDLTLAHVLREYFTQRIFKKQGYGNFIATASSMSGSEA